MPSEPTKYKKATNLDGFDDPTNGRVTSANTRDGMKYQLDGKEVPFEDGFSLSVGRDKTPSRIRSSFTHISQERWNKIFKKK
jgi:hypothetical protein|tara:strand:- start:487 stop:732 length:246 start_codon:yes stop_codon:yes gene_type:complete